MNQLFCKLNNTLLKSVFDGVDCLLVRIVVVVTLCISHARSVSSLWETNWIWIRVFSDIQENSISLDLMQNLKDTLLKQFSFPFRENGNEFAPLHFLKQNPKRYLGIKHVLFREYGFQLLHGFKTGHFIEFLRQHYLFLKQNTSVQNTMNTFFA